MDEELKIKAEDMHMGRLIGILSHQMVRNRNNPSDVMPYYGFLKEFGVTDIQAAVRMLYSIGELEQDSMSATINNIVRRNYELSDKAEITRYMDSTSMMKFSEYFPTFFVAFKMAVDMMLVVTMYL